MPKKQLELIEELSEVVCRRGHKGQWVRNSTQGNRVCVSCRNEGVKRHREAKSLGLTHARSERGLYWTKIPNEQFAEVRARYLKGETQASLAKNYGVTLPTITRILRLAEVETRRSGWTHQNKKTHCLRGHELIPENRVVATGACKTCIKLLNSKRYQEKKSRG